MPNSAPTVQRVLSGVPKSSCARHLKLSLPLVCSIAGAAALAGCGLAELDASPEPMGEPIDLGEACAEPPAATGSAPGDVAADFVGFDQYGERIGLYDDLCTKTVVVLRAGFD